MFLTSLLKALSNPKIQKYILYGALVILILIILSRGSERVALFLKGLKLPSGDNVYSELTPEQTAHAQEVAGIINGYLDESMWDWITSSAIDQVTVEASFASAVNMPDNQLYYLTRFYKSSYMKSFYKAIKEESFLADFIDDNDEKLLQRLEQMNLVN